MDHEGFRDLIAQLGAAWNAGDAVAAAGHFAERVDYADPLHYRFGTRAELEIFFRPPSGGHRVSWHRVVFDVAAQVGVVEYTYVGHHRYHGAAIVELAPDGAISAWREWQHFEDERDWDEYLGGPKR